MPAETRMWVAGCNSTPNLALASHDQNSPTVASFLQTETVEKLRACNFADLSPQIANTQGPYRTVVNPI